MRERALLIGALRADRPRLGLSRKTVERHRENVLAELGMRDRVELARYAIRRGLVEP
jgi:DNA-binding NarL/FixJ family response regulator